MVSKTESFPAREPSFTKIHLHKTCCTGGLVGCAPGGVKQHVLGLEVAKDNIERVQVAQGQGELRGNESRLRVRVQLIGHARNNM